jgi:predicted membrane-bound dolichyl-phosphate-mannose-protein mannosyltransferase
MDGLKKIMGLVWAVLGPALIIMMLMRAGIELQSVKPEKFQETIMFWVIVIGIFVPIAGGLTLFGIYAFKGEYNEE